MSHSTPLWLCKDTVPCRPKPHLSQKLDDRQDLVKSPELNQIDDVGVITMTSWALPSLVIKP